MEKDKLSEREEKIVEFKTEMRAKYPEYKQASKIESNLIRTFSFGCLLGGKRIYAEGDDYIRFVTTEKGKFEDFKEMSYFDFTYDPDATYPRDPAHGHFCKAPALSYAELWNEKTKGMENPEEYYETFMKEILANEEK